MFCQCQLLQNSYKACSSGGHPPEQVSQCRWLQGGREGVEQGRRSAEWGEGRWNEVIRWATRRVDQTWEGAVLGSAMHAKSWPLLGPDPPGWINLDLCQPKQVNSDYCQPYSYPSQAQSLHPPSSSTPYFALPTLVNHFSLHWPSLLWQSSVAPLAYQLPTLP